jgi:hypothetical protein
MPFHAFFIFIYMTAKFTHEAHNFRAGGDAVACRATRRKKALPLTEAPF